MTLFFFSKIVVDREEFQHVNVSKKEVDELFNDIFNSLNSFDFSYINDFTDPLTVDTNWPKKAADDVDVVDLNATLITPVKQTEESLSTPETDKNQLQSKAMIASSPGTSNANMSNFYPSEMSTPAKVNFDATNQISSSFYQTVEQQQQQHSQSFNSFNSTLLPPLNNSNNPLINQQFTHQYPTNDYSITSLATPSNVISSTQSNGQHQAEPIEVKRSHRAKRSRFKNAIYKELENFDPNTVQSKVS